MFLLDCSAEFDLVLFPLHTLYTISRTAASASAVLLVVSKLTHHPLRPAQHHGGGDAEDVLLLGRTAELFQDLHVFPRHRDAVGRAQRVIRVALDHRAKRVHQRVVPEPVGGGS